MFSELKKDYPGKRAVKLFFIAVLLLASFTLDFIVRGTELIDLIYVIPMLAAAVLLTPLETLAVGIFALMLEFVTESPSFHKPSEDLWSLAGVGAFVLVISLIAAGVQKRMSPLRISHEALAVSPLAYAEFSLPDCSLIGHNEAFLTMAPGQTGAGEKLNDIFPQPVAQQMVGMFDKSVSAGGLEECKELHIPGTGGKSSFW